MQKSAALYYIKTASPVPNLGTETENRKHCAGRQWNIDVMWAPYCLSQLKRGLLHRTSFRSKLRNKTKAHRHVHNKADTCHHVLTTVYITKYRNSRHPKSSRAWFLKTRTQDPVTVHESKYTPSYLFVLGSKPAPNRNAWNVLLLNIHPQQRNSEITNPLSQIHVVYKYDMRCDHGDKLYSHKKKIQGERRWKSTGFSYQLQKKVIDRLQGPHVLISYKVPVHTEEPERP
jgi:hypothetical protein